MGAVTPAPDLALRNGRWAPEGNWGEGANAKIKGKSMPAPGSFSFCPLFGFLLDVPWEENSNAGGTGGALAGLFCLPEAA